MSSLNKSNHVAHFMCTFPILSQLVCMWEDLPFFGSGWKHILYICHCTTDMQVATNQLQGSFWISMWELHPEVSETPIRSAIFDLCFHFINKQLGGGNTALTIYQIVSDRQQGNGCECGGESIFGTTNKIGYIFLWHYLPRADSVWLRMTVEYQGKQAPYLHGACLLISAIVLLPWAWSDTSI